MRTASARYRLPRVVAVVAIALVVAATIDRSHDRARQAAARWQPTDAPVLVVVEPVAAGELIGDHAVAPRLVPVGLQPADALDALPPEARATADLSPGEVLRSARIDQTAASAVAALLPPGRLAFTVPAGDLDAAPGDTVRLFDLTTASVAVRSAAVLTVADDRLTVAVAETDAGRLIAALGTGGVVAAVAHPGAGAAG